MLDLARRSPLQAHWGDDHAARWHGDGLTVEEVPFAGTLLLRGTVSGELHHQVTAILGNPLPDRPNALHGTDPAVLWMAPSRWVILARAESITDLGKRLRDATAVGKTVVSDVSDGHVQFDISGRHASELLATGFLLDLHDREFPVGRAAQSRLDRIDALICRFEANRFGVCVDASLADYAWRWFTTNARLIAACKHAGVGLER